MNRRNVLAAVGGIGTVGIAGCSDLVNQATGGDSACSPPDLFQLQRSLPEKSGGFVRKSRVGGGFRGDAEDAAIGEYTREGSNETFEMGLYEYTTKEEAWNITNTTDRGPMTNMTGYVTVGKFVFYATAPDRQTAKKLIKQNENLSAECVEERFEYTGSAGTTDGTGNSTES